jgi:tetratricopeptide (TPR) repeat protein
MKKFNGLATQAQCTAITRIQHSMGITHVLGRVFLLVWTAWLSPVQAAPYTPKSDSQVIGTLPFRANDSNARELATLRAAVAKDPTDSWAAVALAQQYFDLAIARGDPRYVGYANAVVDRFAGNLTAPLLLVRGTLRQYRHDFGAALDDYAAALAMDADLAGAHAWRAAIYLVQARYDLANIECQALQRLDRVVLYGGCAGMALAYSGHLDQAYVTLQNALSLARHDDHRLWLQTRLGEVAAWRGQPARAEAHFRRAVSLGQDDGYLLAAWSDFLLDQGRPAEVLKLLANWEASDGLLLRLAEAEAVLKLPRAATHIQTLDARFAAAKSRGDTTHRAEEARFQLRLRGDAKQAAQLAAENYRIQREPRDARIALEAALAVGDPNTAKDVQQWLLSSRFEDPRLRALDSQIALLRSTPPLGGKP